MPQTWCGTEQGSGLGMQLSHLPLTKIGLAFCELGCPKSLIWYESVGLTWKEMSKK